MQVLSGDHDGLAPLPAPFEQASLYPWLVRTRYYSATLWLMVVPLDKMLATSAAAAAAAAISSVPDAPAAPAAGVDPFAPLKDVVEGCGGVVALFDDGAASLGAGWSWLTGTWEHLLDEAASSCDVSVALGVQSPRVELSEKASRERTEWALDRGIELLTTDVQADREAATAAAAAARGEAPPPSLSGAEDDPEVRSHRISPDRIQSHRYLPHLPHGRLGACAQGLARLVEALQCRMWPPLDGVAGYGGSGPASKEEVHKEHQSAVEALRAKLKQASPKQAVAEPSASSQAEAKARRDSELAQRDAQAEAYLEQLAGEPDDACYEALREHAPGAARR